MKTKYQNWILENYPTPASALSQCQSACQKMKQEFPELELTNGLVLVNIDFRQHWWLKDGTSIIDPTAHQYLGSTITQYDEISDDNDLRQYPQSRCINCGELYFYGKDGWRNGHSCSMDCCLILEKQFNKKC